MDEQLVNWAKPRLQRLLPLDDDALRDVLQYTVTLSKDESADHLKNLLGDSSQALEFIVSFNSRRADKTTIHDGVPPATRKKPATKKPPLHSAGPVRQPEGYGNVIGGYNKRRDEEPYMSNMLRQPSVPSLAYTPPRSPKPDTLQLPQTDSHLDTISQNEGSRNPSPAGRSTQKPGQTSPGFLMSDMPNVRSKQAKKSHSAIHSQTQSRSSTPQGRSSTTTTTSVADLTSAIAALELATNPTLSSERRKCECNASIHPLFTTAPNCLSCGKIICALEGLQPCSFCDAPILTRDQVNGMIKALKEERGIERMANHNANVSLSGRGTPMFSSTPDSSSGDEASTAAARARAHRDKLLAFQRDNVQRTKVHDEAADYDTALSHGATQWMSPVQRAAALKQQQKYLRELQEANRPEWEKKRTVMSMSIKNGKLVKTYGREKVPGFVPDHEVAQSEDETSDATAEHQRLGRSGTGAFSHNPLLVSGQLIRPVWKAKDGHVEEGNTTRGRQNVWRKVQDDNDDNEQWILDGGLHGYGTQARLMEDGSQQECG